MDAFAVRIAAKLTEVAQPRVGALDRPTQPHGLGARRLGPTLLAFPRDDGVVDPALEKPLSGEVRVITTVEPDGLDVAEQPAPGGIVEGRLEQDRIVAVGPVDGPPNGDAVGIGQDGPLPTELRSVRRVLARSLPSSRAFVQRTVDGNFSEVQADDLVVGAQRLVG